MNKRLMILICLICLLFSCNSKYTRQDTSPAREKVPFRPATDVSVMELMSQYPGYFVGTGSCEMADSSNTIRCAQINASDNLRRTIWVYVSSMIVVEQTEITGIETSFSESYIRRIFAFHDSYGRETYQDIVFEKLQNIYYAETIALMNQRDYFDNICWKLQNNLLKSSDSMVEKLFSDWEHFQELIQHPKVKDMFDKRIVQ